MPSCVAEFAAVVKLSSVRPVGTSSTRNDQKYGISPPAISNTLNANDITSSTGMVGLPRRAASSAPPSAPSANTAEASPNAPAPVWNT